MVTVEERARRHAALGDPARLTIVDELLRSDRTPTDLRERLGIASNLMAHHLDVLEEVGLIERRVSSGDRRRRYVTLRHGGFGRLVPHAGVPSKRALFVCSRNSARSQLAAALWRDITKSPADSAGTDPADRVHPGAVAAAKRARLDIGATTPRALRPADWSTPIIVTVCDQAHEELEGALDALHWSITDPVPLNTKAAFDHTVAELRHRIEALVEEPADD